MRQLTTLIFSALFFMSVSAQKYESNWKSIDSRPVPEWFSDVKFGIFIH